MYHIGINAFHANASIALFKKNNLIFAIEEERLNRIKNWFGFPFLSLQYILDNYKIDLNRDISSINFNFDSDQNFAFKLQTILSNPSVLKKRFNIFEKSKKQKCIKYLNSFGLKNLNKIKFHDHHTTHINYSFYTSKFNKAFIVSLDGFGDQKSGLIGLQNRNNFEKITETFYPHSLGIFYQAFTQLLGFKNYGDEYKVMGMSAYGSRYISEIDEVVNFDKNNLYKLNLDFFNHHKVNIEDLNENSQIEYKNLYSSKLYETFKKYSSYDIAYTIQKKFEDIVFKIINEFNPIDNSNLCLTGGCALNSLLNGKIYENCPSIKKININATPNDSGGSIGAVLTHLNKNSRMITRSKVGLYTGIGYSKNQIKKYFENNHVFKVIQLNNNDQLIRHATEDLIDGKVIGWFQGKMEWGPRSLGNRSILANPSYPNIKNLINKKIKRRESFRPFAPSILIDQAKKWFHYYEKEPHMIKVYKFKKEKTKNIPSVVHKDLTGRLQTVEKKDNKLYYNLIKSFYLKTDIPLILNTSFNENEPVVNTPTQALNCFYRNDFDTLYMGNFKITKLKNSINKLLKFNNNISIIILCFNEELHIERLIRNIKKFTSKIFVVDSFSSDKTIDILNRFKINYSQRKFISYSDQLNWAIKNNPFKTEWIFRMDSDELLNIKLVKEIEKLMNTNIQGIMVKRNVFFLNSQLSNGVHQNSYILRVWRKNLAYCSDDLVDEQIILKEGIVSKTKSVMIEKNLKGILFYLTKHLKYSSLEANNYFLNKKRFRLNSFRLNKNNNNKYEIYYKLPLFIRPIIYFFYLLFFKSPFKDGLAGLIYLILQTLIYRLIVDLKILTISLNNFLKNAHK